MPPHISAFVYIMAMAVTVFLVLEKPMTASLMTVQAYRLRRNVWLGIVAAAFLSHNYFVFIAIVVALVVFALPRERNPMALYFTIFLAVPNYDYALPGFGLVNYLHYMSHSRLMAILVLAPLAFRLVQSREPTIPAQRINNSFVLMFCALSFTIGFLAFGAAHTTANKLRYGIDLILLTWLPFYVASRYIRDLRQFRETLAMMMVAFCLLGLMAVFESVRGWLMFEELRPILGMKQEALTTYMMRESEGGSRLRATTVTTHSIVLGYALAVGMCLWAVLRLVMQPRWMTYAAIVILVAGSAATLARGPWVGAAVGIVFLVLTGPGTTKRAGALFAVILVIALVLAMTPFGERVMQYIPFLGNVETHSIDYRARLFEVSMSVFWDHPLLGNFNVMSDSRLEQMRQGQGIIDMVNSYLGIGLQFGAVGLILFLTPFLLTIRWLFSTVREVEPVHPFLGISGRAIIGAMVTTLVTIATCSSIDYFPIIYWNLLGLATVYLSVAKRWQTAQVAVAARAAAGVGTMQPVGAAAAPRGAPAGAPRLPHRPASGVAALSLEHKTPQGGRRPIHRGGRASGPDAQDN
jgi:hypothetical protein